MHNTSSRKFDYIHQTLLQTIERKTEEVQENVKNELLNIFNQMIEALKNVPDVSINRENTKKIKENNVKDN